MYIKIHLVHFSKQKSVILADCFVITSLVSQSFPALQFTKSFFINQLINQSVNQSITNPSERLGTIPTFKWIFSRVNSHMCLYVIMSHDLKNKNCILTENWDKYKPFHKFYKQLWQRQIIWVLWCQRQA